MRSSALLRGLALVTTALSLSFAGCSALPEAVAPGPGLAAPGRAYAFPAGAVGKQRAPAPPISLTASDGSGLRLVELTGRAVVEEPLAFTELHLWFENPEDRTTEANFAITLPEGAALSRFAMRIGDEWQEGEVVEKQHARRTYEDFLHKKQDPALLEQAAGNEFSARVFPIPAKGRKEIVVSYSQEVTANKPYALSLEGLPKVDRLDVSATVVGSNEPAPRMVVNGKEPSGNFRVEAKARPASAGLRNGDLALVRVRPMPKDAPEPFAGTMVLVDTSASRALGFEEEIGALERLVATIAESGGKKARLVVACYDQTAEAIFDGEAGGFDAAVVQRIRERQAFGASNLGKALAFAGEHAKARGLGRVVLLTDGVATAGATDTKDLAGVAARLRDAGVERLDAVALGGLRDEGALHKLATAGLAHDGVVVDGAAEAKELSRKLTQGTRSGLAVVVEGATWSWPQKLDGVQAGDEVLVYAQIPAELPVRLSVGGSALAAVSLAPVERPLLERASAVARIKGLLERLDDEGKNDAARNEVIALATKHRVMSPFTSFLVLETDADFDRYHIDRKATADILVVDQNRVAVARRSRISPLQLAAGEGKREGKEDERAVVKAPPPGAPSDARPAPEPAPARPAPPSPPRKREKTNTNEEADDPTSARGNMWGADIGDSFGAGGLGLSAVGEGGGGRGEGTIGLGKIGTLGRGAGTGRGQGFGRGGGSSSGLRPGSGQGFGSGHGGIAAGAHMSQSPQVRMGATSVSGRLPPEVIQRIVRQNFGRIRKCYEDGLRTSSTMAGRVTVRFVIEPDGSVVDSAGTTDGTLTPVVGRCVANAMKLLSFPPPEGGKVTITYPFQLSPAEGSPPGPVQIPVEPVAGAPPSIPIPPPPPAEPAEVAPYTGRFKAVMDEVAAGSAKAAIRSAYDWHREAPGDVMALVALGEALEAAGETETAARAYGSIVDLFPARADLRRFAGERLERLAGKVGLDLAIDTFEKAEEQRPDHPASHRLLAFARLKKGDLEGAFHAAEVGSAQSYPPGRFAGVDRILKEDLGLIAAAWIKAEPSRKQVIVSRLEAAGATLEDKPSLRFVLNWETDANDVDFHITDAEGHHAYYKQPSLASGGRLYADVTTGYGPECFTIRAPKEERSASYSLRAHYYSRGPMGYGMGKLEIVDHDGQGGLTFEERPFVVMADKAFVDLGTVKR